MIISLTAEYALRAIVHLATDENASQTVGQIAQGTRVPPGYLSKVLQNLSRVGLITSQRGLGGGFRLAKSPQELSILEVVQSVDPIERIHTCPLGLEAHGTNLCPLHRRLDNALALIEEQFRATTIAELLADPSDIKMLDSGSAPCVFPLTPAEK
ncbi:MAG TPA: Rrf2 family transcriptional regulator [Abditibacteriaceae bacterium]